jgi:signal transduction histidine kinase/ligand-binding sensor domain-containing protein
MNRLQLIIFLLLQAISLLSFSQNSNIKFTRLTTSDGLSQNSVFATVKDYRGFMWFATDEGLNKYDGYKFTVYKHDAQNKESISNSSLYSVFEDAAHNLWVLTAEGLDRFDRITEKFIHYNTAEKGVPFRSIFQDSLKRIWLGSAEGFYLFDPEKKTFRSFKNSVTNINSLGDNYVYKITCDNFGDLWIGTRKGLDRFNPTSGKFKHYNNLSGNSKTIGAGYVKTVFKDSKGNIWVGTQGSGISLFNRNDDSFISFKHDPLNLNSISHNDILSFTEDNKGNLWIGTENGGISIFNQSKNNFISYKHDENDRLSITDNSIHSLYKDDIGNIWVGTWSGGISFLPVFGDKFNHYKNIPNNHNSLSNNLVLCLGSDHDNNVWIGTDGGGLNLFNPKTHVFTAYRQNSSNKNSIYGDYVLSLTEYLPGILALGFHRGGIDLFDIRNKQFTHYALDDKNEFRKTSLSVNLVYNDSRNNLYLSTHGIRGVDVFDYKTKQYQSLFIKDSTKKTDNGGNVFAMYESTNGQFWIGGSNGLDLFNRDTKQILAHYEHNEKDSQSISNNTIHCIIEDNAGNLWLGTSGGLNFFDHKKKTFTTYTEKDGLPNNTILGLLQDRRGNLWISSNQGLSKFNIATKVIRNYTTGDGLQSNTFKPKAAYQAPDGEMFFGGVNGFNSFYPDSIKDNDFVPPVYITNFQVFNKTMQIGANSPLKQSLNEVKEIKLTYLQSVFTFEFAALNFTHPEQNNYAYKLEGFDDNWNYVGNKRSATYTNLNPGTYLFRVKASNNDDVWNEKGTSIKVIILPPFWLTWWFVLLMFLLIAGSIVGFYLFRMSIIQNQKILLEQKVTSQTLLLVHLNEEERKARLEAEQARAESELARQQTFHANEDLKIKNKDLEQFAYVASHDLQEPLRTTTGFIQLLQKQYKGKIDEKADLYLNFISDASDRMRVLIKDLLDFSRIGTNVELQKIDCNLVLQNMLKDINAAIEESKAQVVFTELPVIIGYPTEIKLLFQNLVINAIKFRKKDVSPLISISARQKQDYWEFAVSDNGIGIEEKYNKKIFDIFQRLHTKDEYVGSGIGLSHCKKIVELHYGKIWLTSTPGKGSTFYFTLFIHKDINQPLQS